MSRINRATATAIVLLVFCGVFFWQTFAIRDMGYATIGAEIWPRAGPPSLSVWLNRSEKFARPPLKAVVLTLATLLLITFIRVWWLVTPVIPIYIESNITLTPRPILRWVWLGSTFSLCKGLFIP